MFILSALILITFGKLTVGQCPTIVSRFSWRARAPKWVDPLTTNPPTHVIISHTDKSACYNQLDCVSRVQSIQNFHMDNPSLKWPDIGYNFLVGEDGNVYTGRGWDTLGAHSGATYNGKSIGISVIGNFMNVTPNDKALIALQELIVCGVMWNQISSTYNLMGHRQATSTTSPGDRLFSILQGWPHWTSTPDVL